MVKSVNRTFTYKHPIEIVLCGRALRYPTNKRLPLLINAEVTSKTVDEATKVERVSRKVRLRLDLPEWLKRSLGVSEFTVEEKSVYDPANRTMLLESKNTTFTERLSIGESVCLRPHPDNSNWTLFEQEATLNISKFPLAGTCERLIIKSFDKRATEGRQVDIDLINEYLQSQANVTEGDGTGMPRSRVSSHAVSAVASEHDVGQPVPAIAVRESRVDVTSGRRSERHYASSIMLLVLSLTAVLGMCGADAKMMLTHIVAGITMAFALLTIPGSWLDFQATPQRGGEQLGSSGVESYPTQVPTSPTAVTSVVGEGKGKGEGSPSGEATIGNETTANGDGEGAGAEESGHGNEPVTEDNTSSGNLPSLDDASDSDEEVETLAPTTLPSELTFAPAPPGRHWEVRIPVVIEKYGRDDFYIVYVIESRPKDGGEWSTVFRQYRDFVTLDGILKRALKSPPPFPKKFKAESDRRRVALTRYIMSLLAFQDMDLPRNAEILNSFLTDDTHSQFGENPWPATPETRAPERTWTPTVTPPESASGVSPIRQGIALKALWRTAWQDQWVVLYPTCICFYRTISDHVEPDVVVPLGTVVDVALIKSKPPFGSLSFFEIRTQALVHYLACPDENGAQQWAAAIRDAISTLPIAEAPPLYYNSGGTSAYSGAGAFSGRKGHRAVLNRRRLWWDVDDEYHRNPCELSRTLLIEILAIYNTRRVVDGGNGGAGNEIDGKAGLGLDKGGASGDANGRAIPIRHASGGKLPAQHHHVRFASDSSTLPSTPTANTGTHIMQAPEHIVWTRATERYLRFSMAVTELQVVTLTGIDTDSRLAFFVNVYHTLAMHALLEKDVWATPAPHRTLFTTPCYEIAGHLYSLADIEFGILRAVMSPPPNKLMTEISPPKLSATDLRFQLHALNVPEPRLNFVLHCGWRTGSNVVWILDEDTVQQQLDMASTYFCSHHVRVLEDRVEVPQHILWFASDFVVASDPQHSLLPAHERTTGRIKAMWKARQGQGAARVALLRAITRFMGDEHQQRHLSELMMGRGPAGVKVQARAHEWHVDGAFVPPAAKEIAKMFPQTKALVATDDEVK